MTKKNFNKQVLNRQRITKETLIIGVDIGCELNSICMMNKEGLELGYRKIFNSSSGFEFFKKVVNLTKKEGGYKEVLMGMEPTGSYWTKLAQYSDSLGYEVRLIKTSALKYQRGLDESAPGKTDKRDAYTLANLTREGKYIDSRIDYGTYRELRKLVRIRDNTVCKIVKNKGRLRRILDEYFPELQHFYSTLDAKGLIAVLNECSFPEDVIKYGKNNLIDLISRASRNSKQGEVKGNKIYSAAKSSIGLRPIGKSTRFELSTILRDLQRAIKRVEKINEMMEELLIEIPCAQYLLTIPGMGLVSTAYFLGELGNPDNFDNHKQIVKFAGYDPVGYDSGKYSSKKHISKKGRWRLRKILYFICLGAIRLSPYFKAKYERKQNEGKVAKKAAVCAVVIDLVKVIFALIRDERAFEERFEAIKIAA